MIFNYYLPKQCNIFNMNYCHVTGLTVKYMGEPGKSN